MMKGLKSLRGVAAAAVLSLCMAGTALAAEGWQQNGNQWWYQNGDQTYPVSQWKEIDGSWYHFDNSGYVETGWQTIDRKTYYFAPSGAMQHGWVAGDAEGSWYYLGEDGSRTTGWKEIDGGWYWFSNTGLMYHGGWKTISSKSYYFYEDGRLAVNTYADRRYVGDDGARMDGHDIKKSGKGTVETQVLDDAGNSLRYVPKNLMKKLVSDGWSFLFETNKDNFGSVKDDNDLVYYRYFTMNTSKKILYFCQEDALLPAIGEYVHSYYGRPALTEAFRNTVGMEWDSLVSMMEQEPVMDKSESLIFDEIFALYYRAETREQMKEECPDTYKYMTEFMAQFE